MKGVRFCCILVRFRSVGIDELAFYWLIIWNYLRMEIMIRGLGGYWFY